MGLLDQLRDEIRVRHYGLRTEKTYAHWVCRYARYHNLRHPNAMGAPEVNAFLTHLARDLNVAASTQNQALSAIVFLYRHVLRRDLGDFGDVVRAKRSVRLPVILSPGEVQRIMDRLGEPYRLMCTLLYGGGLRLMELVRLRLKDIDFDYHRLCVRDGKGGKDRFTLLPECIEDSLRNQIARVLSLHQADLRAGFGTVHLPHALARKYRSGTLRLYRQVLRDLRSFLRDEHGVAGPGSVRRETAEGFLVALSRKNVSWSWMASAIGVMRNVFDRLGGLSVTTRMVTPRRNWPLPEPLSEVELRRLLDVLPDPRNRLLVALLAGCGLRVSEACRVRWSDFDRITGSLRLDDPEGLRSRNVFVPPGLLPLFRGLAVVSRQSDPMVCGPRTLGGAPKPLSVRQAERVVQSGAVRAGLFKRVSPMSLRHSFAVRRLVAGDTIRALQVALGHRSVLTTLRYQACLPPKTPSPADPEPPPSVYRQAAVLLGRLAEAVPPLAATLSAKVATVMAPAGIVRAVASEVGRGHPCPAETSTPQEGHGATRLSVPCPRHAPDVQPDRKDTLACKVQALSATLAACLGAPTPALAPLAPTLAQGP